MENLMKQAKEKIQTLNFDQCVELYEKLEAGHPMIDLVFDRMEELDEKRFDEFLG